MAEPTQKMMFGARVTVPLEMDLVKLKDCIDITSKNFESVKEWQTDGDAAVQAIKKELDDKYGAYWHVIAGKSFGSKVTHETKEMCFFYLGDKAVLIFKC